VEGDIEESWKIVQKEWGNIKNFFLTFQEWYHNRELFHLIGYLITVGMSIRIIKKESVNKSKSDFNKYLKEKIKLLANYQVTELNYSETNEKKQIKNILLLFNIISIINNRDSSYKFQFGKYKSENWDIEHIHAVKSEMPEREDHRKDWLNEMLLYTEDNQIRNKISSWLNTDKNIRTIDFSEIYDDCIKKYSENGIVEDINDISNLTLLDAGTNRGLKNSIYPIKRMRIIDKDQNGIFIPPCTKNVFLKYYNYNVSQMTFWGKQDRESYKQTIINTLIEYLPQQNS
jgi:hypothetical protein